MSYRIFTHGRRLQGAVKDLSTTELESVQGKLANIIEKRKQKEREEQKVQQEKLEKIAAIQKQMNEAGLDVSDFGEASSDKKKTTGQKRPVKYKYTGSDGEVHSWTGVGRMPKVFKQAIEQGKSLEDFSI